MINYWLLIWRLIAQQNKSELSLLGWILLLYILFETHEPLKGLINSVLFFPQLLFLSDYLFEWRGDELWRAYLSLFYSVVLK